jgi:hypothetical protein
VLFAYFLTINIKITIHGRDHALPHVLHKLPDLEKNEHGLACARRALDNELLVPGVICRFDVRYFSSFFTQNSTKITADSFLRN